MLTPVSSILVLNQNEISLCKSRLRLYRMTFCSLSIRVHLLHFHCLHCWNHSRTSLVLTSFIHQFPILPFFQCSFSHQFNNGFVLTTKSSFAML
ncbi:hypothetical protein P9112_006971 [Eukaryota sp. TZLM1-RC]